MAQGLKVLVREVGLTIDKAVQILSTNPARMFSLNSIGALFPGMDADIVVLDRDFKVLMTIIKGYPVYKNLSSQEVIYEKYKG